MIDGSRVLLGVIPSSSYPGLTSGAILFRSCGAGFCNGLFDNGYPETGTYNALQLMHPSTHLYSVSPWRKQ